MPTDTLLDLYAARANPKPPLTSLGLAVLSPAGTVPLYVPHASWVEAAQDLE